MMKVSSKCIIILIICLIVACSNRIDSISGTWIIDNSRQENKLSTFGSSLILGTEITFQDKKCVINPMGLMKMALDVEESKNALYLNYEGTSFIIKIIDKDTIGIEMYGTEALYRRKKE